MNIKPIRSEQDYADAVREIERLWGAPEDTPEGDKLDILATLVDAYERERWTVEPPDPIAAIQDAMQERDMSQADLGRILGSRQRAHEVLTRKRALSKEMIHAIHEALRVPAEILIQPYELTGAEPRRRRNPRGLPARGAATA